MFYELYSNLIVYILKITLVKITEHFLHGSKKTSQQ